MIRIEEALARARQQGRTILKKDIAARLWPDASEAAQKVYMSRLCSGRADKVAPEWVQVITEMTGCTADFLFGIKNENEC